MTRTDELKNFLRERSNGGIALAFSGGVDSTLLLSVLNELCGESSFPLLALTMRSIFQEQKEIAEVKKIAAEYGIELAMLECDPLSIPEVKYNPPDRCYWCKRYIFSEFRRIAKQRGMAVLLDGTNADDVNAYRPGRRAIAELGVISPLAELGFTKAEIRALAGARGLRVSTKPSAPCLATRFEYGALLTADRIEQAAKGEEWIRKYVPETSDVRLRVHANIARIEVSPDAVPALLDGKKEIATALHSLGFEFVTLDLEGFRSGCFDQNIRTEKENVNKTLPPAAGRESK